MRGGLVMLLANVAAAQQVQASLEPAERIVVELLADTDGDGRTELVLVTAGGEVRCHGMAADGGVPALAVRSARQLRDPAHSLFTVVDVTPAPGAELVVADAAGTVVVPWSATGEVRPLSRVARFPLRVGHPRLSPFVQDLDRDGRPDLLLPTLAGCVPYLQEAPAGDDGGAAPRFRALPVLPVRVQIGVDPSDGSFDDEHQGSVVIPQVERADLDGDGRPDLVTQEGTRHAFHLQRPGTGFAPPIVVDIAEFQDSTPAAVVAPGSTLVLGDAPLLQRGDIDGDGIPDFVIAHRRKVWTFRSSAAGPQFTKARTQAVADDVSGMLLVDLDEDARADLLTFQVQLPGIGALLLGLVQSIDIDVKAVCYRSDAGAFVNAPTLRRTVTLRVPPLLSLLARQQEIVQRFLDLLGKARPAVRGAFVSAAANDLAMVSSDGTALELFARTEAPTLASVEGRRQLRRLLFEDPDPVFDLERIFALISGLLAQRTATLTGDQQATAAIPLRDAKAWKLERLLVGALDE
ncbi:MAG: VCBS repeat-containing protein, partial [Planctomycetota bacterium]